MKHVQRMVTLEFVVLTLGAFLQPDFHGITTQYHQGCKRHVCEKRGTMVLLNERILSLLGKYGNARILSCIDVLPIGGLFALVCSYKFNFDTEDGVRWFPYSFSDRVVSRAPTFEGVIEGYTYSDNGVCQLLE